MIIKRGLVDVRFNSKYYTFRIESIQLTDLTDTYPQIFLRQVVTLGECENPSEEKRQAIEAIYLRPQIPIPYELKLE